MHFPKLRLGDALTLVWGIMFLCLSGCSNKEPQIQAGEVTGVWKLDAKTLDDDDYSLDDFSDFSLSINSSGRFVAAGIPRGIFLNESSKRSEFEGTWSFRYDGYNYIDFTITNLPGYTSGTYGLTFDWKDGRRVIRLSSASHKGFIYITRVKTSG